jgi:hypothetical protein
LVAALLCSAAGIALAADGGADPVPPPAETIVAGPVDGGRYYTTPMPLSGPIADLVFSVYATDVLRAGDGALWVRDYMSIVRIAPDGQSFRHVVGLNDYDAYQDAANLGIGTPMERIGSDASSVRMQLDWKPERTFDLDPQGRLVFVDRNAVFRIGSTGLIEHVAGTGTAGSSGDGGPAVEAEVAPTQLRVDASGAIWFADSVDWPVTNPWPGGETRIRRVDPDGTISTFAALPPNELASFAVGADGTVARFRFSEEVPGSWAVVDLLDAGGQVVRTVGLDTDRCAPPGAYDRSRMSFDGQRVDYIGADSETGDLSICWVDLVSGITQRSDVGVAASIDGESRMSNVEFTDEALWYVRDVPDDRPNSGLVRRDRPSAPAGPTVSLGDQSGLERDTTTGSVFVPVYLSEPVAEPVVVQFHTADGSANAGTDYTRWGTPTNPRTVTIPAGQVQTTINVPVLADSVAESDEGFSVVATLASGGGVTLGDAVGAATIVDADAVSAVSPAITVSEVTVHEGDDGQRRAQFHIHLSRPSPGLTLAYQTVAGSASWPGDFARKLPGMVTFAPGQISKTIDVAVLPNRTPNGERSFGLALSTVGGPPVEELRMTGTARIVDDD